MALTPAQWQEISDLWSLRPRTVTIAQLGRRYGINAKTIREGLRERGFSTAMDADEKCIYCACGCGCQVGRTHIHAEFQGRLFRNARCLRRWNAARGTDNAGSLNRMRHKSTVAKLVPKAVRKTWPKTWCVRSVGETIYVYRSPQERGRALITGTLIVPLWVIHTMERT